MAVMAGEVGRHQMMGNAFTLITPGTGLGEDVADEAAEGFYWDDIGWQVRHLSPAGFNYVV
jgi:hypothetical protein